MKPAAHENHHGNGSEEKKTGQSDERGECFGLLELLCRRTQEKKGESQPECTKVPEAICTDARSRRLK